MKRELAASAVAALVLVGPSAAAWSGSGTGTAGTRATTMGGGNTPAATAPVLSTNVTVNWTRSAYGNGALVQGYIIRRYNALTGASASVGASCSGIVGGSSCTESGVAAGSWKYTVTPAQGSWRGTESAQSAAVTVPGI
jgi:hypothetical protein